MESDAASSVVAPAAAASGLTINLHPLAILNISDHYTRAKLTGSGGTKLFGALLGTQVGRDVSIVNSFELIYAPGDGNNVDTDFFATRSEQFNQVFPTQSVVGWYTVGAEPTSQDVVMHSQIAAANDGATTVFLLFNPDIPEGGKQLPFAVYESVLTEGADSDKEGGGGKFAQLECGVETGEAERIAVDGVTKDASGDGDQSGQVSALTMQRNAIAMLYERVVVLAKYVSAVVDGTAPVDHNVLRQIAALVATLPVMEADEFKAELETEYDDTQLTNYLTTLLQQLEALAEYSDKHSALYPANDENTGTGRAHKGFGGGGSNVGFGGGGFPGFSRFGGGRRRLPRG